ncbi:MAG: YceI family protein [Alphaproteobacteria bacterium]
MRNLVLFVSFLFMAACAEASAPATWTLDSDQSRISFVSIKAAQIAEPHHFKKLEGSIDEAGKATVEINLDSVETLIDIRNERMRKFFFETANFPVATITAQVDLDQFADLPVGGRRESDLTATLDLHGASETIETAVYVTRIAEDRVTVATVDPVIIDVNSFDLAAGLNKLMELAGLDSITSNVPVTFSLVFQG